MLCAFHKLGGVFLQARPDHRCKLPYEPANATYDSLTPEQIRLSIPKEPYGGKWSSCQILDTNFTEEYFKNGVPANTSVPCNEYIYDYSKYSSSAVIEVIKKILIYSRIGAYGVR